MPSREDWKERLVNADLLYSPLAPPVACPRCLRPLPAGDRHWGTCYQCGREHGPSLPGITAITYGADGTKPWSLYQRAKFSDAAPEHVEQFVTAIAAALSLEIEQEHPEFSA